MKYLKIDYLKKHFKIIPNTFNILYLNFLIILWKVLTKIPIFHRKIYQNKFIELSD